MKFENKQNRRDFLISSARKIAVGGLGLIGLSMAYKNITSDGANSCEVNLPCRNCFKLGKCEDDKAIDMRKEVNQKNTPEVKDNGDADE